MPTDKEIHLPKIAIDESKSRFFPIVIQNQQYQKLFAVQTKPYVRYWFKDREVTQQQILDILHNAKL